MGVIVRGKRLRFRFKGPDGRWRNEPTEFVVGQEAAAQKAFARLIDRIAAGVEVFGEKVGPVTVADYSTMKFFPSRRDMIEDWKSDERRLELHVLPTLGGMRLSDVKTRHLVALFQGIRGKGQLAPKSIWNVYGVVKALFRDAIIDGLTDASPCVLDERHLGPNEDADPEWRDTAVFTRAELEMLISDPRIPADRQMLYAIEGIGAARHGEAVALRFRHWDPSAADVATGALSKLVIARSHEKEHTKTKRARAMPVHPVLAAMLAEWKLSGWPAMMGRQPTPDDLVVPMPAPIKGKGRRAQLGSMRTNSTSYKRWVKDLELLGLRHRRGHDLRATMITLAQEDGAQQLILEQCTHTPKKGSKAIGGYTRYSWPVKSREVAKLKISRSRRGALIELPAAVGDSSHSRHTQRPTMENQMGNALEAAGIETVARDSSSAQSSAVFVGPSPGSGGKEVGDGASGSAEGNARRNGVTRGYEARARAAGFKVVPPGEDEP